MFHKATNLIFRENTTLEISFQGGEVKSYDMAKLFEKYPQLEALKDRELFTSGRLLGPYGISWNDDLDIEAETIYLDGETVRIDDVPVNLMVGDSIAKARADANMSQKDLSKATGIDQSDISKIERGISNPSLFTLNRIANALDMKLTITFERK